MTKMSPEEEQGGWFSLKFLRVWIRSDEIVEPEVLSYAEFARATAAFFRNSNAVLEGIDEERADELIIRVAIAAHGVLVSPEVDFAAKGDLIKATEHLFADRYAHLVSQTYGCEMFWDVLVESGDFPGDLKDVVLERLTAQLEMENRFCQWSALHGLNHLHDPRAVPIIDDFITSVKDDPELVEYAELARENRAL